MRIRCAIGIPLSPTIEATRASGAITCETNYQGGFIPKKLEVLELTVPPRMFLLSNPVRFISNKQLKLFLKHMKRELKPEEHEEIVSAVAAGDRIKAKNIYLSATEGNLTDAQNYLRTLSAKAEVAESERFVEKSG